MKAIRELTLDCQSIDDIFVLSIHEIRVTMFGVDEHILLKAVKENVELDDILGLFTEAEIEDYATKNFGMEESK